MESNTIRIQTNHFHIYLVGPGSGLGVRRKRRKLRLKELSVRIGSNTNSRVSLDLLPKLVKQGSSSHPEGFIRLHQTETLPLNKIRRANKQTKILEFVISSCVLTHIIQRLLSGHDGRTLVYRLVMPNIPPQSPVSYSLISSQYTQLTPKYLK